MDYHEQIRQSFWQGMVKLVILHQASMGPVYGGGLSKYLCGQGLIKSALEASIPCFTLSNRKAICGVASKCIKDAPANTIKLPIVADFV